ncbi:MAG: efflux RND transporter periplasmic adaptor subunit, partial [Gammaproteobacteria bacterium]
LADRAELDLSRTTIVAPFSGRIAGVHVAAGDRVRPGDALADVFDTDRLEVRAQIPLRYLPDVQAASAGGLPVQAGAEVDGRSLVLALDRLSAAVGESSGGADALFRVTGGAEWLQLGRIVSLGLSLPAQADVVALPYASVYGANRIFVIGEGERLSGLRIERIGERRTARGGREVLVRSPGLEAGSRVLVTQLPNAVDGLKVKARE